MFKDKGWNINKYNKTQTQCLEWDKLQPKRSLLQNPIILSKTQPTMSYAQDILL